jgi:translocation protein SEC63
MATYEYDEAGVMAAYFLITFLALILVPLTISSLSKSSGEYLLRAKSRRNAKSCHSAKHTTDGCQCTPCVEQRQRIIDQEKGSLLRPKLSRRSVCYLMIISRCSLNMYSRTYFLIGGWSMFAFVCYRVSQLKVENKIYNPFEILGIKTVRPLILAYYAPAHMIIQSTPEKEIKSHFKQLSKL